MADPVQGAAADEAARPFGVKDAWATNLKIVVDYLANRIATLDKISEQALQNAVSLSNRIQQNSATVDHMADMVSIDVKAAAAGLVGTKQMDTQEVTKALGNTIVRTVSSDEVALKAIGASLAQGFIEAVQTGLAGIISAQKEPPKA